MSESVTKGARKAGPKRGWVVPREGVEEIGWPEAVADFCRQALAAKEQKTKNYYRANLERLGRWADANGVALADFRARHFTEYIAQRAESPTGRGKDGRVCQRTLRHDAITCRVFLRYCASRHYVARNPLAEYVIPKAPKPYVKCPSADEIRRLLRAIPDRWSPAANPRARYMPPKARTFLARRDYAVIAGLVDSAARIGELLALRLDDVDADAMRLTFRETKTDTPRTVPISPLWKEALEAYLRVRPACDSPLLFISRTGQPISASAFWQQFRDYSDYAGLSGWTLHGLRHYALTQIARVDVMAAQRIAGHTSLVVTQGYLHTGDEQAVAAHAAASSLAGLLVNRRVQARKARNLV